MRQEIDEKDAMIRELEEQHEAEKAQAAARERELTLEKEMVDQKGE